MASHDILFGGSIVDNRIPRSVEQIRCYVKVIIVLRQLRQVVT